MNQPPLLVLGVDPGTAITGYGIVRVDDSVTAVAYGAIRTPAGQPLPHRLQQIHRELSLVINQYRPTEAAVEELFFAKNARTALAVGHARGVILFALAEAGLTAHEYTPLQVKQAITGYGRATKEQIQQMVRLLLNLASIPQPDDVADALAVAICHAHTLSVRLRMASAVMAGGGAP
jgi:crossover junction endodeoxyribonuclease RuvC